MKAYLVRVCAGLNALLLLMAVVLFSENGPKFNSFKELAVVALIFLTPAFTLFTLFAPDDAHPRR